MELRKIKLEEFEPGIIWVVFPCVEGFSTEFQIEYEKIHYLDTICDLYYRKYSILFSNYLEIKDFYISFCKKKYAADFKRDELIKRRQEEKKATEEKLKNKIQSKTYIMKDSSTGLYKIGRSINPEVRERTLQSEKPSIKMVKVFEKNIERQLHSFYSKYRVRGEWFDLTNIQIKYICTHY
jgi:hypothetical protein